jgi:hypothetical protein
MPNGVNCYIAKVTLECCHLITLFASDVCKGCANSCLMYVQDTYTQSLTILGIMAPTKIKAIRLSPAQEKLLAKLSKKLGVDTTNVIRIAIQRLAESEGIQ